MRLPDHRPTTLDAISLNHNAYPNTIMLYVAMDDPSVKRGKRRGYIRLTIAEARAWRDSLTRHIAEIEHQESAKQPT